MGGQGDGRQRHLFQRIGRIRTYQTPHTMRRKEKPSQQLPHPDPVREGGGGKRVVRHGLRKTPRFGADRRTSKHPESEGMKKPLTPDSPPLSPSRIAAFAEHLWEGNRPAPRGLPHTVPWSNVGRWRSPVPGKGRPGEGGKMFFWLPQPLGGPWGINYRPRVDGEPRKSRLAAEPSSPDRATQPHPSPS